MYSITQFHDRTISAFSVPPSAHPDLSDDFKELSRIHFYLGRHSIDFMLKAVESASLEDIEKGRIQLYFASKEIQDFLSSSWNKLDTFKTNALESSFYFQKSFNDIFKETVKVLDYAYKKPTKKHNLDTVETMLGLTQESIFLSSELSKIGIQTEIKEQVEEIKSKLERLLLLKPNYDNLSSLKDFNEYENSAKQSVIKQLSEPYEFNYTELGKNVYLKSDEWMHTLHYLLDERKKFDDPEYVINKDNAQRLKDDFIKQFKSFNNLLKNGIVNYTNSFSAAINTEAAHTIKKSYVSAEDFFNQTLSSYEKIAKTSSDPYIKNRIKELNETKEAFIKQKLDDKAFHEQYLTVLYRQEANISQAFDKIRVNLLNTQLKDEITFEGDITEGFVVGSFSNTNKVILIHKDIFVDKAEAVYAMVIDKNKYENLVKNNTLIFTEELRNNEFENSSNFWSYGQFLQEIRDPFVQKHFLGQEFDLVDKSIVDLKRKSKLK